MPNAISGGTKLIQPCQQSIAGVGLTPFHCFVNKSKSKNNLNNIATITTTTITNTTTNDNNNKKEGKKATVQLSSSCIARGSIHNFRFTSCE